MGFPIFCCFNTAKCTTFFASLQIFAPELGAILMNNSSKLLTLGRVEAKHHSALAYSQFSARIHGIFNDP